MLGLGFNMLGSNLRHSHVWLTYGRVLEHVFISPGSLRLADDDTRPARFGLSEDDENHDRHGLVSSLVGPLAGWLTKAPALSPRPKTPR